MNFSQDVIAVVWDFDKTLIPTYMQKPLFETYGVNEKTFWDEVGQLMKLYREEGLTVNPDTLYLNHLLAYVQAGIMPDLTNQKLRDLGAQLEFFPGIPELFHRLKTLVQDPEYSKFGVSLENYVVSTGLSQMIRGSKIGTLVEGIWGCEFIESPRLPDGKGSLVKAPQAGVISSIGYTIDNTTKTRAIFEINKGVNLFPEQVSVNQRMKEEDRRVPIHNMIYLADGPSDIPAFSVVKRGGGRTLAVYTPGDVASFRQAKNLLEDERVHHVLEADYRAGGATDLWLTEEIRTMAQKILQRKKQRMEEGRSGVPKHLN